MTPYDPRNWTSHLFDVEGSMVRKIVWRVIAMVVWSTIVVALYFAGPEICHRMEIPSTAHALIGTALGLLLVFRTNSSYDRFWEGRKQWGGITNECRNLARQASVWIADRQLVGEIIRCAIAFPFATMTRLRNSAGIGTDIAIVSEIDVARIQRSSHVPLAIARAITSRLLSARDRGLIDSLQLTSLDQNVQLLVDYCGACERIRATPMPFAYAVHLRRVLIVYCLTLPFALVKDYGWSTVLTTLLISYSLFGVEEIGVEIENPFGVTANDLSLESFCEGIRSALLEICDETK